MKSKRLKIALISSFLAIYLTGCSNNRNIEPAQTEKRKDATQALTWEDEIKNSKNEKIKAAKAELLNVGHLIYKNETGLDKNKLVYWNPNEGFPSLGIGHFIWYPKGYSSEIGDMLPSLIEFYKKHNFEVPQILTNRYAPWKNRSEMESARKRGELDEVIEFFDTTKDVQIFFIYQRLQTALDKMVAKSNKPEHVKNQFTRVIKTKNGLYPLIDYVNFKGEGITPISSYNNISWGLRQVLENMSGENIGKSALNEFSQSCISVLKNRVKNQPSNKKDDVFLEGWIKRCQTYANAL